MMIRSAINSASHLETKRQSGLLPEKGAVLGLDVGYSPSKKSSAVCRLTWDARWVSWTLRRFRFREAEWLEAIRAVATEAEFLATAFDGPLRRGFDQIGRYRAAEQMLTQRLGAKIGKPGQASSPVGRHLNAAANTYVRAVLQSTRIAPASHAHAIDQKAVVEAFPSNFLGVMIDDPAGVLAQRKDRSDVFFKYLGETGALRRLISHLLPGRTPETDWASVTNHDDRAALVCALTALGVAGGDYVAVGDDDGWIVLPPRALIQRWAWSALETNAGNSPSLAAVEPRHP